MVLQCGLVLERCQHSEAVLYGKPDVIFACVVPARFMHIGRSIVVILLRSTLPNKSTVVKSAWHNESVSFCKPRYLAQDSLEHYV